MVNIHAQHIAVIIHEIRKEKLACSEFLNVTFSGNVSDPQPRAVIQQAPPAVVKHRAMMQFVLLVRTAPVVEIAVKIYQFPTLSIQNSRSVPPVFLTGRLKWRDIFFYQFGVHDDPAAVSAVFPQLSISVDFRINI